jgi:hypothetical protein
MSKFKVGDTVKIIGNNNYSENKVGDIGIIQYQQNVDTGSWRVFVEGGPLFYVWTLPSDMELVTSDVPIGYTGLPKDMNLKDGDVIKGRNPGYTYKVELGELGGVPIEDCQGQYTLVSRADTPQENPWFISGDTKVDYTTHDVAEWQGKPVATRKKLPVVETVDVRMYQDNSHESYHGHTPATVVTTDGVPDWSTLKVKS